MLHDEIVERLIEMERLRRQADTIILKRVLTFVYISTPIGSMIIYT
jgi:hypothetical protein